MGCCGKSNPNRRKRRGFVPNSKLCPQCGWLLNQVHKYNAAKQQMATYQQCSNKLCKFKKLSK